ncbi:MAG: hypothetical protein V3U67_10525, partial [Gemmatimonadota bacterium]
ATAACRVRWNEPGGVVAGETASRRTQALEHHIGLQGTGGYPVFHYQRQPHPLSRLVQVCDIYDALRTKRPYRDAWPVARTLSHLQSQAGELLDPEYVDGFLSMIQKWEPSLLDHQGEPIPTAAMA